MQSVEDQVKALRAVGCSVTQIAEVCGVSRPTVYAWSTGGRPLNQDEVSRQLGLLQFQQGLRRYAECRQASTLIQHSDLPSSELARRVEVPVELIERAQAGSVVELSRPSAVERGLRRRR